MIFGLITIDFIYECTYNQEVNELKSDKISLLRSRITHPSDKSVMVVFCSQDSGCRIERE